MNKLFIDGLKVETRIGVYAWEKQVSQNLVVDLELHCDLSAAASSDDIADAVDYSAVCEFIKKELQAQEFNLIERCAAFIIEQLKAEFLLQRVRVKLRKKGAVRGTAGVGVVLEA